MSSNLIFLLACIFMVLGFALVLGAQMFDTFVNVPLFLADPPDSIARYLANPVARNVPVYFARVIPIMIVVTVGALVANFATERSAALFVSVACATSYIALVFLFFLPANRKLGFLPPRAGSTAPDADTTVRIARQWRLWNVVRIGIQFAGLIAAVLAVSPT